MIDEITVGEAARRGAAYLGNARMERPSDEVALIRTQFLWPDNDCVDVAVRDAGDGWFELSDDGDAYNVLSNNGMDHSSDKETGYVDEARRDAIYGLMDEVLKHGCGLSRSGQMIYCRARGKDIGAAAAWVLGSALEIAALAYPWRAGLIRGGAFASAADE